MTGGVAEGWGSGAWRGRGPGRAAAGRVGGGWAVQKPKEGQKQKPERGAVAETGKPALRRLSVPLSVG
ncbi:hypothetical protein GCM10009560_58500 [Nonomuraea longicatena]|uniref:Uncharacterized protein n=1 Tax=Nonomuraea longicatena TaxID=83682 RepID=A0ABP4B755_9ACTN